MPCQILVANKANNPKGSIISIVGQNHKFSKKESMQEFLSDGGAFADWWRVFSIVKVTDRGVDDLSYLFDENENGDRIYSFLEPSKDSEEWQELYETGQVERSFNIVQQYIVSN